jgi:hypothetical protein
MKDEISLEESMRHCLVYFEAAARSVVKSPQESYDDFGSFFGAASELRQELLSSESLLNWSGISIKEKNYISKLIEILKEMPTSAIYGAGLKDFMDPYWDRVREVTSEFLKERRSRPNGDE